MELQGVHQACSDRVERPLQAVEDSHIREHIHHNHQLGRVGKRLEQLALEVLPKELEHHQLVEEHCNRFGILLCRHFEHEPKEQDQMVRNHVLRCLSAKEQQRWLGLFAMA